jgi:hypothetical protein
VDYLTGKSTVSARAIPHCNWRVVFIELLLICTRRSFELAGGVRRHFGGMRNRVNLLVVLLIDKLGFIVK